MTNNKRIHFSILKNILLKDEYITTQELSKIIGVSPKTITNYMDKVKYLCYQYNLQLISKKSKGYFIEAPLYIKQRICSSLKADLTPHFKEERKLFLLHMILTAKEPFKISYLEYVLHISRPSVYKCLDTVGTWLSNYNLVLHQKNYQGIFIDPGEKRRRLALTDWYIETKNFLHAMKRNDYYSDVLKLQKCLDIYDSKFDEVIVKNTVLEIQTLLDSKCLKDYSELIQTLLKISLLRISENNSIGLCKDRTSWATSVDLNNNINKINSLIYKNFNIKITNEESIYFFSLILAGSTSPKKEIFKMHSLNDIDFESLESELQCYLNNKFVLSESLKANFLKDIKFELEGILTYLMNYEPSYISELSTIKAKYPVMFEHALNISSIIQKYTHVFYSEKFITSLTYLLSNLISQEKQPIKAIFIHNCNSAELNFVLSKLKRYFIEVNILEIHEFADTNLNINYNKYDLVLTTIDYEITTDIKVLKLNKSLAYCDIIYYNSIIHDYYEFINENRILLK